MQKFLLTIILFFSSWMTISVHQVKAQGLPAFEEIPTVLEGVTDGSVAWGDYDGDGDLDVLLTGRNASGQGISQVYRNNGDNTFTDINAGLAGVSFSSVAWGDYDGDGDLDILLTGFSASSRISQVYRNDGGDNFTAISAGLEGVSFSSVAWGDYDGDGDLDILLTGQAASGRISRVYRNNGDNTFEDINAGLEGVGFSSVAWGDYDGDGDLDILLSGQNSSGQIISRVYRNNGDNTFEDINAGLEGVYYGSAAWGDYDGDGDLDILLTGFNASLQLISRVYRNNGDETFTAINAGLEGVYVSSAAWGDYDGDGDLDILLTGSNASNQRISLVYRNNGDDTFTAINAGLEQVGFSSVSWGDYDGDGDLDILLTGFSASSQRISKIYRNNSVENGTTYAAPSAPTNLSSTLDAVNKQVTLSWDAATDNSTPSTSLSYNVYVREQGATNYSTSPQALEADGWRLLPALGNAQLGTSYIWNYADSLAGRTFEWRVQAIDNGYLGGAFSATESFIPSLPSFEEIPTVLEGVLYSSVSWGDYDGDGDLDILLTGSDASSQPISKVYRNNGDDTFTDINAGLEGVWFASVAWGDYDGDGDLDILLTGQSASGRISLVYRNNGDETFTDINAGLEGVNRSSVAWGDYDGDGDLDILLTGQNESNQPISLVYRNNGDETFTDINAGLEGVNRSSVAWGDYDGDGDLDILLTGSNASNQRISLVYRNNGDETFTDINAGLEGVILSSVAWGDYDGDGDLDILLTGLSASGQISRVYRNNGDDTFTAINAGLEGVWFASVAWGDYDGDGDLDILLTGQSASGQRISRVYRNNGDDTFTDINAGLEGVDISSSSLGRL